MLRFIKRLSDRFTLMNRMGDTVGAPIGDALAEGRLSANSFQSALLACGACRHPVECRRWLEEHAASGAEAPPGFCRNAQLLDRLAHPA